jgi:hypothetical protein
MSLPQLIADPNATVATIGTYLDGLSAPARWAQLRRLDRGQQRTLYQRAGGSALALRDLVPNATALVEEIHDGVNTLPVPAPLRRFQKRFCWPLEGDGTQLYGYNEGPLRRLIGPGYFLASTTAAHSPWAEQGSVVVDYFAVPQGPVAPGWPTIVPNSTGLQRGVYDRTRDFLWRVSSHVSIGAATKDGTSLDHYFVLCRRA